MTTLEKIKKLQYFNGLKNLRIILEEFFSSVTALETNSVIVAEVRVDSSTTLNSGTLTVGRKYYIDNTDLQAGDDFTNVGFVVEGQVFTATGTTPTDWSGETPVTEIIEEYSVIYNDIDNSNLNISLDYNPSDESYLNFTILNNGFTTSKSAAFTGVSSNYSFTSTNNLAINISANLGQNNKGFVKIEVYN